MAGITLNASQAKRQRLLDLLPEYDWSIIKAAIAAGYSKGHAHNLPAIIKTDKTFCDRIIAKQQAIKATEGDEVEELKQFWAKTRNDPKAALRDRLKASELEGKCRGIFSETRVLEVGERQRVLAQSNEQERKVLCRLALQRFDTTVDAQVVHDGSVVNAQSPETEPKQAPSPAQTDPAQVISEPAETPLTPQTGYAGALYKPPRDISGFGHSGLDVS